MSDKDAGLSPQDILAELEPYRGRKGAYKRELGDRGLLLLHALCDGSIKGAMEFLGYARSRSVPVLIANNWARLGLSVKQRDSTVEIAEPWLRFQGGETTEDLHHRYLKATSGADRAYEAKDTDGNLIPWKLPADAIFARLILVADLHTGVRSMDYPLWIETRDRIAADKYCRWLGLGDYFDLAQSGKHTESDPDILTYNQAHELLVHTMKPIASQCIGLHTGNHDRRVARAAQLDFDPIQHLCRELTVPYLGYDGFVRHHLQAGKRKRSYTGYVHHGRGGGRKRGYTLGVLSEFAENHEADYYAMGHLHEETIATQSARRVAENGTVETASVLLIAVSSFQRLLSGTYAANTNRRPAELGASIIHLHLDDRKVVAEGKDE